MNILGLSCFHQDPSACLIMDGTIVAAVEETKLCRAGKAAHFPLQAVNYCLQAGNVMVNDIDLVGFYEKPFLKFARLLISHLRAFPSSFGRFLEEVPFWLEDRLILPILLKREISYEGRVFFIKHLLSHGAGAFLTSPFEEAAILVVDDIGEWATTSFGTGRGTEIRYLKELHFPDSLGLYYSALAGWLGFDAEGAEGRVAGLASEGNPAYLGDFEKILDMRPDGSFSIDETFFSFQGGAMACSPRFFKRFGQGRRPGEEFQQAHRDMAATLRALVQKILVSLAGYVQSETGLKKLCLAGSIALNSAACHRILEETDFEDLFIQPWPGDSGSALGAAVYICHTLPGRERGPSLKDAYLGPEFTAAQMKRAFQGRGVAFRELDEEELTRYLARRLGDDKVVGLFQGRAEFGPRPLGNRSILAGPQSLEMKMRLNSGIKSREPFVPFQVSVPVERAREYFHLLCDSPYAHLACSVKEGMKSVIPAATLGDGTCAVHTVRNEVNPRLWALLVEFEKVRGVPVLINASFRSGSEPPVCTPAEAVAFYLGSDMDCLVMGNCLAEKEHQFPV